jgi:hypothetical protein
MFTRQLLLSLSFTLLTPSAVFGEAQCPGNVETIRYHSLAHSQIGVSVSINHSGPYEFMVDTGSQITIVEPSLATELQLSPEGNAGLTSGVRRAEVQLVRLDLAQVGPYSVEQPLAAVQSLAQIQVENPKVRGILGENFLTHFDLLIDQAHSVLCLDKTKQMQKDLQGEHIPLVTKSDGEWNSPLPQPVLVPVRLSESGSRGMILRLDSGANVPQLYVNHLETAPWVQRKSALRGSVTGKSAEYFSLMPRQDVRIGKRVLRDVTFATPVSTNHNVAFAGEDGLLPTALFNRVFISYSDHFAVFDPR